MPPQPSIAGLGMVFSGWNRKQKGWRPIQAGEGMIGGRISMPRKASKCRYEKVVD